MKLLRVALVLPVVAAAVFGPVVVASASPRASSPPDGGPTAQSDAATATIGQLVRVHGTGWGSDTSEVVSVVLCGNAALDGLTDCDPENTAAGGIRVDGTFFTAIVIKMPVLPCPCVLRVTSLVSANDLDIPISVVGAPVAPPHQRVIIRRSVSVHDVHLEGRGAWLSWFGAHPNRVLVYSVTNTGTVTQHAPATDVVWGRGSNPSGFVQAPAPLDLAVNQTRTYRVHLPMTAFSWGTYRAIVRVDPFGPIAVGQAQTTVFPWGLFLVAIVAAALLVRAVIRRRRQADEAGSDALIASPGWYADPLGEWDLRLWDGASWTTEVGGEPIRSTNASAPGWYSDPSDANQLRVWDGSRWTEDVRPHAGVGVGS